MNWRKKTIYLRSGLDDALNKSGEPYVINQLGSMISVHFSEDPVIDFATASAANNALFNLFFHGLLDKGIYLPPSAFETWFICNALSYEDIDKTIDAVRGFFRK